MYRAARAKPSRGSADRAGDDRPRDRRRARGPVGPGAADGLRAPVRGRRPAARDPRRPAAAARAVPQRVPGLHVARGPGRGTGVRARRDPALAGPRLPRARAARAVAAARDDDLARLRHRRRGVRPDDARGARPRRAGQPPAGAIAGAAAYPVVVIGCGMSGLLAAIRLQQAGFPFVVVEKNDGPGGTWFENRYPGARVDVGSHFYSYSFEPADHWTEFFSRQPELLSYFERVADERASASTSASAPRPPRRRTTTRAAPGRSRSTAASSLPPARWCVRSASSTGRSSRTCPGEFAGAAFHTARWPDDADLAGKDVVMVGAGATGFQVAPAIADAVRSLTVLQRTAQWMFPNPGYHDVVGPGRGLGDPAPAVLRALVPVPHALAGLRRRAGRGQGRPGLGAAAAVRERGQRPRPHDVHRVDHQPGGRGPGAGRQGRAALPADREAHAPGQRLVAADPDPRQRRARAPRGVATRAGRGRRRGRRPPPGRRPGVGDRLPRQRLPGPDDGDRPRRSGPARALGSAAAGPTSA